MEIWDLYDKNRILTGKTHVRGERIPEGSYHLVVHVWLRAPDGRYLMSRRAPTRKRFPMLWECVGGAVVQGEDTYLGAVREVYEEVGIDLHGRKGKVIYTKMRDLIEEKVFRDILDVWLFDLKEGEREDLERATTDEVAECLFMTKEEILALDNEGALVPTLVEHLKKLP